MTPRLIRCAIPTPSDQNDTGVVVAVAAERAKRPRRPRSLFAFTIIELIVAIGVTLVLILGVGRIFSMSKTTISIGEATAELAQYGRTLERVMRDDFDAITRDGFLVIRNERLGTGALSINNRPVNLNQDAEKAEEHMGIRRLDQLVFFKIGDFTSSQYRDTGGRGIGARNDTSREARIWYGHAFRAIDLYDPEDDDAGIEPEIKTTPGPNGYRVYFADPRPQNNQQADLVNKYAEDWILARQEALLLRRETATARRQDGTFDQLHFAPSFIELFNEWPGDYFVGKPYLFEQPDSVLDRTDYNSLHRRLSPGLVDLIDMDLVEVEKTVTDYGYPFVYYGGGSEPRGDVQFLADPIAQDLRALGDWALDAQSTSDVPVYGYVNRFRDRNRIGDDVSEQWLQGQWLRMAMATGRIRAETAPPSTSRRDQMLTHATFAPGCSNFEIAWSTGEVSFPEGDIVWYDIDNPANPYIRGSQKAFEEAPDDPRIWYLSELPPQALTGDAPYGSNVWPLLNQNGRFLRNEDQAADLYYGLFGYFVPQVREGGNKRTGQEPTTREDRSDVWPWPSMIRIRITLHDQGNRIKGGRTFEFVFDLPSAPVN